MPWQRQRQFSSTSSGFLLPGQRVLTNAHSVEWATAVSLSLRGDDAKHSARVLAVGTECDIALLAVDDAAFWAAAPEPLQLGALPRLQDAVAVVGFPVGGDTLCVTSGVVSRVEVTNYVHGSAELLGVQIDAAINAGNSGGPVLNEEGECVGVAFQSLKDGDTENCGFVIPTPVVAHFLADFAAHGAFTGFPSLGIEWQSLEAPALRASLGMEGPKHKGGVLITRVEPTAPAASSIRRGDVLLAFNDVPVAGDGTVPFRAGERIAFGHLVSQCFVGDKARLKLLRDGEALEVSVELGSPTVLIPPFFTGTKPPYLIVAGLVFLACSEPYLRAEFGEDYEFDAPVRLLDLLFNAQAQARGQQVVLLSQVLAADINTGYDDLSNLQLLTFNDRPVSNLAGLAAAVAACTDQFFRFGLDSGETVVLDAAKARAATPGILATHGIPSAASADLMQ